MKCVLCVGPLLLLGFWLVGCDNDPLTDLSISSIEVTQDAPTSSTVGLVSQRRTIVQVMLETDSSYNVTGVAGVLSVAVDGVIVTTDLSSVNEPVTVSTRSHAREDASLYFDLEAPTGISASSDVDLFVTLTAPGQFVQGRVSDLTFGGPDPFSVAPPSCVNPSGSASMSPGPGEISVRGNDHLTAGYTEHYPPTPRSKEMFNPVLADARKSPP